MPRLTAADLLAAPSRLTPTCERDRELSLRARRLGPDLEHLGVLRDGFSALDLSDNEFAALGAPRLPAMRALRQLSLCNNRVARVAAGVGASLPLLDALNLANNRLGSLADAAAIGELRALTVLTLLGNGVTRRQAYRLYFVHALPRLRLLDLQRVTRKERLEAARLFASKRGKALLEEVRAQAAALAPAGPAAAEAEAATAAAAAAGAGAGAGGAPRAAGAGAAAGGGLLAARDAARLELLLSQASSDAQLAEVERAMREGRLATFSFSLAASAAVGAAQ
jgi:hypothetical protein